ncbi:putative LYS12-homo-isocitrate dehydrogenase [Acaromyces ingoldii]|uniref:Putative LYS12-homo-isocitrate dehydrogenase n=1 Tax=Acaromyces ingoldii TaxID=215250 RepID=A0A316YQ56_9BASI|nr:putative LYS12-homo-isocitrate dehydrogenase [Acaromyces ingoldii]PWN90798.1 putative LYS12-homo-isocitrate dehydrogenase [Acaromyces ingoldii]
MTNTAAKIAAQAGRALKLGMMPADGIGKEVLPCAARVLQSTPGAPKFDFVTLPAGFEHFQKTGSALPDETVRVLREECDGAMFGSVSSPSHKVEGYSSPIVKLRKELDLYANIRPVVGVRGTRDDEKWVDTVIVRENTECLYIKSETIEEGPQGQVARAIRQITERASKRIGKKAFDVALAREALRSKAGTSATAGRGKVTVCHKSNVLSVTDGLFRTAVRGVYESDKKSAGGPGRYEGIDMDEQLVDSMVYRLFREPHVFDVVVAPNLYGDIISDGAAALVGSLGVVASVNAGDTFFMGEPVHGSAPDIAGQNKANPIASIRSAALLLEYMGYSDPALKIYKAVDDVIREGKYLTPDLQGTATTSECEEAILRALQK